MIPWRSTRMPGYPWISMNVYGCPCILMPRISIGFKDNTRTPMNIHGYPRRDMHNHLWISKVINVSHQNHNDRASERASERARKRASERENERPKTDERMRERTTERASERARKQANEPENERQKTATRARRPLQTFTIPFILLLKFVRTEGS